MDRSWMYTVKRSTPEFRSLVKDKFVRCALENAIQKGETGILCPCIDCQNSKKVLSRVCVDHLVVRGFMKDYTRWIFHGEPAEPTQTEVSGSGKETEEKVNGDEIIRKRMNDLIEVLRDKFNRCSNVKDGVERMMALREEDENMTDEGFIGMLELISDVLPSEEVFRKLSGKADEAA